MLARTWIERWTVPMVVLFSVAGFSAADDAKPSITPAEIKSSDGLHRLVNRYCLDCHDSESKTAGLDLTAMLNAELSRHLETWEQVARKLSTRHMPPMDAERPAAQQLEPVLRWLEKSLDEAAAGNVNPGRTESFRRLTRTEYRNAIRDLLALELEISDLLPPDESSQGFDNITVAGLSPTLVSRYLAAAEKISRIAVGRPGGQPAGDTIRLRPDITQDSHIAGLPLGTRGGALIPHNFLADGEYEIQVRLMRDRNEGIEGLKEPHELQVLLDREHVASFTVEPPPNGQSDKDLDANLNTRLRVKAGMHDLAVTFLKKNSSLLETTRQPLNVHFNYYRHPRLGPAIYEVSILGPFHVEGTSETESRRRIFVVAPNSPAEEETCANQILTRLMRRAYRGPVTESDLETPLRFYRQGREEDGFDRGIELALAAILVNPRFLFRIEADPMGVPSQTAYALSDYELASRMSFFLWSSIPDDELLNLAENHELHRPSVLNSQVRRMLTDRRSQSLVSHFAGQWLHLKNLDAATPDMRLYPDFDHNLREAFRKETELFFESILREDRSVLTLIQADYTFLNERLAKHYGVPHIYGSHMRRVDLSNDAQRGGLLRHGSILTVTSYATRTSPVLRGKWILENLLGAPPPPPPDNVPPLEGNTVAANLSVRERLAAHRDNPACASCHNMIDPLGFALENYDAVGRWRTMEDGQPVDASGSLADGAAIVGVAGLEQNILNHPEWFVRTLTEKLMTYALGRGMEYYDAPAVRKIVADAHTQNDQFSALISGIVQSAPFQMRRTE